MAKHYGFCADEWYDEDFWEAVFGDEETPNSIILRVRRKGDSLEEYIANRVSDAATQMGFGHDWIAAAVLSINNQIEKKKMRLLT